jgi:hypothetical protein
MESEVLERILLELVVGFEDTPNRKNMSTAEIESTRLVESPTIRSLVTKFSGIGRPDATEFGHEIPRFCSTIRRVSPRVIEENGRVELTESTICSLE